MPITAKIDEFGKPAWIALIVLGFWAWWPLGLAMLAFTIWSGRMGCGYHHAYGHDRWQHKMERLQRKMDWMRSRMSGNPWGGNASRVTLGAAIPGASRPRAATAPSTSTAWRRLRRLEEEQREFRDFLQRLRFAKDKTEFDQFMAERRDRPEPDSAPPPQN